MMLRDSYYCPILSVYIILERDYNWYSFIDYCNARLYFLKRYSCFDIDISFLNELSRVMGMINPAALKR